jgi:hypothetical protein
MNLIYQIAGVCLQEFIDWYISLEVGIIHTNAVQRVLRVYKWGL